MKFEQTKWLLIWGKMRQNHQTVRRDKVLHNWMLGRLGTSIAESLTVRCDMNEA